VYKRRGGLCEGWGLELGLGHSGFDIDPHCHEYSVHYSGERERERECVYKRRGGLCEGWGLELGLGNSGFDIDPHCHEYSVHHPGKGERECERKRERGNKVKFKAKFRVLSCDRVEGIGLELGVNTDSHNHDYTVHHPGD
jgi:hypothetical protein